MKHFVTKEQVKRILEHHGHHVVMDSAFVTGAPMTEIEAIVDVCDVVAQAAYDHGVKDAAERHIDLQNQMADRVAELTEFNQQLRAENEQLCEQLENAKKSSYQDGRQDAIKHYGYDRLTELEHQVEDLRQTNKDLARAALKPETNEAEELEKAIETIQVALSGSFRDNLKLEVSEQYAWLVYGNLKFLVEPMESWQAVQSCVYLSGLEVDNE